MKKTFLTLVTILMVSAGSALAEDAKGTINFTNVTVPFALSFYTNLTGVDLQIDPSVRAVNTTITVQSMEAKTKIEATKLLTDALANQAGVVIARIDDHRAYVTCRASTNVPAINAQALRNSYTSMSAPMPIMRDPRSYSLGTNTPPMVAPRHY